MKESLGPTATKITDMEVEGSEVGEWKDGKKEGGEKAGVKYLC